MYPAKLYQLLDESEIARLKKITPMSDFLLNKEVKNLTIENLRNIWFLFWESESDIWAVKSITELTKRAEEKDIPIYSSLYY